MSSLKICPCLSSLSVQNIFSANIYVEIYLKAKMQISYHICLSMYQNTYIEYNLDISVLLSSLSLSEPSGPLCFRFVVELWFYGSLGWFQLLDRNIYNSHRTRNTGDLHSTYETKGNTSKLLDPGAIWLQNFSN